MQIKPVSDSSVRVSWQTIKTIVIMNYVVYYSKEGEVNKSIIVPSSTDSIVIEDLSESSINDYKFQIAASANMNGEFIMGERSAMISLPSSNNNIFQCK